MSSVVIAGYQELLAFHRAIIEAKFHGKPNDPAIPGSPFVSDISCRVIDALIACEEQMKVGSGAKWTEWRALDPTRREWKIALTYVSSSGHWRHLSLEKRIEYVRIVVSPFTLGEKELEQSLAAASEMSTHGDQS